MRLTKPTMAEKAIRASYFTYRNSLDFFEEIPDTLETYKEEKRRLAKKLERLRDDMEVFTAMRLDCDGNPIPYIDI